MMDMESQLEQPRKKPRLTNSEDYGASQEIDLTPVNQAHSTESNGRLLESDLVNEASRELKVGITHYLSPQESSFTGILKKRYTDFLVNEILPNGRVLHLEDLHPPQSTQDLETPVPARSGTNQTESTGSDRGLEGNPKASEEASSGGPSSILSDADVGILATHFGEELVPRIQDLYAAILEHPTRKSAHHPTFQSINPITDRTLRTQIHQDVRRIFQSRIETSTRDDGHIVFTAAPPQKPGKKGKPAKLHGRQGRLGWDELGGEFLHFTIYKENKDTMEVISYLAKALKMGPKPFQFAGTKDRRAVTVQRASVYRVEAKRMASFTASLRNSLIGDFKYERQGLELGDLAGNEFVITLRDCKWSDPEIQKLPIAEKLKAVRKFATEAMNSLRTKGFFNYFGLQRFGTFASRTDLVGLKLLQEDFKGAVELILDYSPVAVAAAKADENRGSGSTTANDKLSTDDKLRALAIDMFMTSQKCNPALQKLPKKFTAESNIIRHLGRGPQTRNDYVGAIMSIPRNLRTMYAHAYQSFVWNYAVGKRWTLYGPKVVEGDLVMIDEHSDKEDISMGNITTATAGANGSAPELDADGEPIVLPGSHDTATTTETAFSRARALTAAEASSGNYTIFDIVLPLPGFDVIYPANAMAAFYKEFMSDPTLGGGLDPMNMRRKNRDFSLSGGYRKVLGRIGEAWMVLGVEVEDSSNKAEDGKEKQWVKTDRERLIERGEKMASFGFGHRPQAPSTQAQTEPESGTEQLTTSSSTAPGADPAVADPADTEETNPAISTASAALTTTISSPSISLILQFQLPAAHYATMALRELTRGGVKAYRPNFGSGR